MAYFANGSEGMAFDDECCLCKFGQRPCPIQYVQMMYNYDAANNKVATDILNSLVRNNGECVMLHTFWDEMIKR